ncbi:DUF348 domain-containing protein [Candidatus Saccharibacteria bacterium]|nr:DUF348 domain-containing protein [Candidatus Saccharibacteria bacterium]
MNENNPTKDHLASNSKLAKRTASFRRWLYRKHPLVVPVTTLIILFFVASFGLVLIGGETVGASDSNIVKLTVDGETRTLPTRAKTVDDLLNRLDIDVETADIVEPAKSTKILEDNFSINIYKARPVTIIDEGRKTTVLSAYQQPRTIVEKAGVKLYPEDGIDVNAPVEVNTDNLIGDQLVVARAKESTINLYGNIISVRSQARTVGDLLEEENIKILEGDTITPARDTPITEGTKILIVRKGQKIVTVEEVIARKVETVNDPNLAAGSEVVTKEGSDGKKIVTYEIKTQNGKEVSRTAIQEVISVKPVNKVVTKGTKILVTGSKADWLVAAGVSPADYAAADYIISRESGWCPTKWQGEYGGCPAFHGAPSSGIGYGLCQATPGYKMASAGADWASNPVTQLRWCTGYASRYGGWQGAYNFWITNHWW